MARAVWGVPLFLVLLSCAGDSPSAPIADCERNHTGDLRLSNTSTRSVHDVSAGGVWTATLGVGQSVSWTLEPGQHRLDFLFANTTRLACPSVTANLTQCASLAFACGADF